MSQKPIIVWFRQELRLSDHPALVAAAQTGAPVICLYIHDDVTALSWASGGASRWWLHHSLKALAQSIAQKGGELTLRQGETVQALEAVIAQTGASAVYFTRGHNPWSAALETRVKALCEKTGVDCRRFGGFLLFEPEDIRNGSGEPYKVYTPFSRFCFAAPAPRFPKPAPDSLKGVKLKSDKLESWSLLPTKPDWSKGFTMWQPGETGAQQRLADFLDDRLAIYGEARNFPNVEATSGLSAHLHSGDISPNQIWHAAKAAIAKAQGKHDKSGETFLKEVLWREFSYHLLHHWPHLPDRPFKPEYADFPWASDPKGLQAWQHGLTGYPIVDAGMRELWQTGIMHNRVRMITASFLIKDLLVPWQEGERWFWDTLVDADIGANAASWQWVAGCGADAAPYFRIFNPVLQGEKFDADGDYVRRFVPELARLPKTFIHKPWEAPALVLKEAGVTLGKTYPNRIIDHHFARDRALAGLKQLKATA